MYKLTLAVCILSILFAHAYSAHDQGRKLSLRSTDNSVSLNAVHSNATAATTNLVTAAMSSLAKTLSSLFNQAYRALNMSTSTVVVDTQPGYLFVTSEETQAVSEPEQLSTLAQAVKSALNAPSENEPMTYDGDAAEFYEALLEAVDEPVDGEYDLPEGKTVTGHVLQTDLADMPEGEILTADKLQSDIVDLFPDVELGPEQGSVADHSKEALREQATWVQRFVEEAAKATAAKKQIVQDYLQSVPVLKNFQTYSD